MICPLCNGSGKQCIQCKWERMGPTWLKRFPWLAENKSGSKPAKLLCLTCEACARVGRSQKRVGALGVKIPVGQKNGCRCCCCPGELIQQCFLGLRAAWFVYSLMSATKRRLCGFLLEPSSNFTTYSLGSGGLMSKTVMETIRRCSFYVALGSAARAVARILPRIDNSGVGARLPIA